MGQIYAFKSLEIIRYKTFLAGNYCVCFENVKHGQWLAFVSTMPFLFCIVS